MPRPDPLHAALDAQLRVLGDDLRHRCVRAFARHLRDRRRAALAAHDGLVTLTLEDLAALVRRSGLRCERSTVPFSLDRIGGVRLLAPSLDRIDPEGAYTLANLRLVCWYVNRARGPWPEALQQLISQGIAARHGARLSRAQTEAMRAFVQGLGPWRHAWSGAAVDPAPPLRDGAPILVHRDPPYAGSAGDGAWCPAIPSGGSERLLADAARRLAAGGGPGARGGAGRGQRGRCRPVALPGARTAAPAGRCRGRAGSRRRGHPDPVRPAEAHGTRSGGRPVRGGHKDPPGALSRCAPMARGGPRHRLGRVVVRAGADGSPARWPGDARVWDDAGATRRALSARQAASHAVSTAPGEPR